MDGKWCSAHNKRMREAQKQERIRKAAPALLEALEKVIMFHNFDLNDDVKAQCVAAIAAARGE